MLDCISGGRLVAGLPLGSPMDVNLCYGITPMEQRERYREAFALTLKAWQAREMFAWNGRYYQLANVNLWPRPIQEPASPGVGPGLGQRQHVRLRRRARRLLLLPQLLGGAAGQDADGRATGRWWRGTGEEPNPYRAGFLQLVAVSETDASAEEEYARHVEYFYHKCLHVPTPWFSPPGQPGLPEPARRRAQSRAADGGSQGPPLPRLRRAGLRHRRKPGDRPPAPRGGGREGPPRGEPDAARADRLHAPRADPEEHLPPRPARSCRTSAGSGTTRAG